MNTRGVMTVRGSDRVCPQHCPMSYNLRRAPSEYAGRAGFWNRQTASHGAVAVAVAAAAGLPDVKCPA